MNTTRPPTFDEQRVLRALLLNGAVADCYLSELESISVADMSDGGMGSLLLIPGGIEIADREFGAKIAQGEFTDADGIVVSVTVNVDKAGKLFELDVWKVDFSPLCRWPKTSDIRFV